eukprot:CAMPEP_0197182064 /NCGR_PEP_ID=MMETSP1423-20130617/6156_1 /TAXON_ID=476441 /ORGANISM="Pseudo-nitzschia heimii, Strain UNC1101" /LENGTH=446 /DNA_ID=CAMNT_0042632433 /DNA_START=309 /DNA_END=1649 /DNA_ORIENTATION=-
MKLPIWTSDALSIAAALFPASRVDANASNARDVVVAFVFRASPETPRSRFVARAPRVGLFVAIALSFFLSHRIGSRTADGIERSIFANDTRRKRKRNRDRIESNRIETKQPSIHPSILRREIEALQVRFFQGLHRLHDVLVQGLRDRFAASFLHRRFVDGEDPRQEPRKLYDDAEKRVGSKRHRPVVVVVVVFPFLVGAGGQRVEGGVFVVRPRELPVHPNGGRKARRDLLRGKQHELVSRVRVLRVRVLRRRRCRRDVLRADQGVRFDLQTRKLNPTGNHRKDRVVLVGLTDRSQRRATLLPVLQLRRRRFRFDARSFASSRHEQIPGVLPPEEIVDAAVAVRSLDGKIGRSEGEIASEGQGAFIVVVSAASSRFERCILFDRCADGGAGVVSRIGSSDSIERPRSMVAVAGWSDDRKASKKAIAVGDPSSEKQRNGQGDFHRSS